MKYSIVTVSALAVVLLAAASSGSTLAALNDVEAPEGNFFHMGSVDIRVGWNLSRNNVSEEDQIPIDNPYSIFDERNITPGDHGEATIGIYNTDNPAYIQFWANQTGDSENERITSENTERYCSEVRNYEEGDHFPAERNGDHEIRYSVEGKDGSFIQLQAPNDNELGENNRNGTERFEFELDGKPRNLTLQIESRDDTEYFELSKGESEEVFSGALEVELVEVEKIDNDRYKVVIEVVSDEDNHTPGLDGLNIDFCGNLSYYQLDFAEGEVIQELGEQGFYGSRLITAIHGNTIDGRSGGWGSNQCVETDHFETDLDERTVTINFTVKEGCTKTLTFATYEKPSGGGYKSNEVDQQVLIDFHTEEYSEGSHSITINLPPRPLHGSTTTASEDLTEDKGELGDALMFTLWYDDGDNIKQENESVFFNGTAHELDQSEIGDGFLLDANLSKFGTQQLFNEPLFIGFKWWLPKETQCNVQTDSKTFDFKWSAKQERHNPFQLIDTPNFLGDEEYSADNYFEAGEFPDCQETGECGPIKDLEDGGSYTVTRTGDNGEYDANYEITRDSNHSVKFEDPDVDGLGEDGAMESEMFTVRVYGESNETVYVKTKAGQFEGTAMLQGEGDTVIDTSNLWTLELVEVNHIGDYTEFKIKVTSDSEEGSASPALSHIEFRFCEPMEKEGYYQLDLEENQIHEPEQGVSHPDLFMAALSARDDGGTRLNPSLIGGARMPENVEMLEERFIIEDNTATAKFKVTEGTATISLASFEIPGPWSGNNDPEQNLQVRFDAKIDEFGPGNHKLTVDLPTGLYPKPGQKYSGNNQQNDNGESSGNETQNVTNQLVSHWKMDNSVGDVNDSEGLQNGDNNGANRGLTGRDGNALEFDGDDSVDVNHVPEYELENGTVMMWFRMDDENENWLFTKDQDSCNLDCGHFSVSHKTSFINGNGLGARIQNEGGGSNDVHLNADPSIKEINSDEWHHVAVSFGADGAKLFVDGEIHDSDSDTNGISGNQLPIKIGDSYDNNAGPGLEGLMDDVRIYNYQVNQSEIQGIIGNASTTYSINATELLGREDQHYSFNGNEKEDISHHPDYELEEGTVSLSFKMNDETKNWIFTKDEHSCSGDCGHLSMAYGESFINGNGFGVRLQSDSGNGDVKLTPKSGFSVEKDEWYDVAVTFGDEGTKLYINGTLHDTDSSTKGIENNQLPIILGHRYDEEPNRGLDGEIQNLMMYDQQLDDQEIQNLHSGNTLISSPPVPGS